MSRLLSIMVIGVVLVATISIGSYIHIRSAPISGTSHQNLNQKFSSMVNGYETTFTQRAQSNNVDANVTDTFNNVTASFHTLENYSSFKSYYANHSGAFSFGSVWDNNYSDFNSTDSLGLNLDYFYFQFVGIYTSANSNLVKPGYTGTITYSINVGTGIISGPNLTINRIVFA